MRKSLSAVLGLLAFSFLARSAIADPVGGNGNYPIGSSFTSTPAYIYASPYPVLSPGAQTAGTVDSSGRVIISPLTPINVNTPPPPFTYASPYPTLSPGTITNGTVDSNGFQIISPLSITRGAVGQYRVNPTTLVDTQSIQLLTDINGRPRVTFDNPQPVYLAPEVSHFLQRGAPFYVNTAPQLFADADQERRGMYIQNLCPTAIWLSLFGDNTVLDSYPNIEIRPGQLYTTEVNFAPTSAIFVFSRSTGCGFAGATY